MTYFCILKVCHELDMEMIKRHLGTQDWKQNEYHANTNSKKTFSFPPILKYASRPWEIRVISEWKNMVNYLEVKKNYIFKQLIVSK